jgi:hypothetical protein
MDLDFWQRQKDLGLYRPAHALGVDHLSLIGHHFGPKLIADEDQFSQKQSFHQVRKILKSTV